jgi:hypothetical protein
MQGWEHIWQLFGGLASVSRLWVAAPVAMGCAATLAYFFAVRRRTMAAYSSGLQAQGPEHLVASIEQVMKRSRGPDADALTAYRKAFAYLLFGDENRAKIELNSIRWEKRTPLVRGLESTLEALRCYLCAHRYHEGLERARRAQRLTAFGRLPKTGHADAFQEVVVELGRVLSGEASEAGIVAMEQYLERTRQPMCQALCLFGLAKAHRQRGESGKAGRMMSRLEALAPHCRPLHAEDPAAALDAAS